MTADPVCASCRKVYVDDPSGMCEDCQEGIPSSKPGSMTETQRTALIGLLVDANLVGDRRARARYLAYVLPGWPAGISDLVGLSQVQAGDLMEALEKRRLSQEAKGL